MKNIISEISQQEKNRILEMHRRATSNQYLNEDTEGQPLRLVSGLIGVVMVGDDEGRSYIVNKVTPLNCGMTEVEFKSGTRMTYGYFRPSEDVNEEKRTIEFKRFGEGVKAPNACEDVKNSDGFETLGTLMFGSRPNEEPNIYEQPLRLVSGLVGVVMVGDDEGRKYIVNKSIPLGCGITEVEFKSGTRMTYGYFRPSEDVNEEKRTIEFKRFGEGVKAPNPCEDFDGDDFEPLGLLMFGSKPNENPNIY